MSSFYPLVYAPDLDTAWDVMPGGCQDMRNLVPTRRDTYASWTCETGNAHVTYASTTAPRIAGVTRKADGTARFFIFNAQSIYEATSPTAATNRSAATYSASTDTWTWTQYGDFTVATNYQDRVQYSTSGAFATLAGSPPDAKIVVSNLGFLMLMNINDGTVRPAGWACCDQDNITQWTVTATNQADRGDLYDTPGPIRAGVALRDTIVAFKDDSIYVAEYVGDPDSDIWAWRLISDKVGCSSPHGVLVFNDKCYFCHRSGFYEFDGAQIRKFGREATNTIFARAALIGGGIDFTRLQTTVDHLDSTIFFCFGDSTRVLATAFPYNVETGKWGGRIQDQMFTETATQAAYCVVKCTQSDLIAFDSGQSTNNPKTVLFAGLDTGTGNFIACRGDYPAIPTRTGNGIFVQLGPLGNHKVTTRLNRIFVALRAYTAGTTPTANDKVGKSRSGAYSASGDTGTAVWNSTEQSFDFSGSGTSSKFHAPTLTFSGNSVEISGIYDPLLGAGDK